MAQSVNDFRFGFNFDAIDITYSFDSIYSKWDGTIISSNPAFSAITKADLSPTWKTGFSDAMRLWDHYSVFNISNVSGENGEVEANIYGYGVTAPGSGGQTAYFDNITSGSVYTGSVLLNGSYARSEFMFDTTAMSGYDNISPLYRGYALLHETGHTLGLDGDNHKNISTIYNTDMTVMSYNVTNRVYNPNIGQFSYSNARFAVTPMAYDIAALEAIYNPNHVAIVATGDDSYGTGYSIPGMVTHLFTGARHSATIRDDGDGIDTFDLRSYTGPGTTIKNGNATDHITGVKIDLGQAIDKNDIWLGGSGEGDGNVTVVGDEYIYIARGTIIENAIGTVKDDIINGNSGNNLLDGGKGVDTINGGAGIDTVSYANSSAGVNVNLALTTAQSGGDAQGDILSNIENIIGSVFNDQISGNGSNNNIDGGGGSDIITGGGGNDVITGGGNDDVFVLDAGDGIDTITDAEASDFLMLNGGILSGAATDLGGGLYQLNDAIFSKNGQDLLASAGGASGAILKDFFPANNDPTQDHSKMGFTIPGDDGTPPPPTPIAPSRLAEHQKFVGDAVAAGLVAPPTRSDPLIIDMNGDGIELDSFAASNALFDLSNDGIKENTGWTKANSDDSFLVIDKNSNGNIDDITEMFGSATVLIPRFMRGFRAIITAANDNNQPQLKMVA